MRKISGEKQEQCSRFFAAAWQTGRVGTAKERHGVRARARAELLDEVGRVARAHLAESGAAGLSVRAIARELGLASAALYRYYPSRDALLTQLIVEAYNELGDRSRPTKRRSTRRPRRPVRRDMPRRAQLGACASPRVRG